MDSGHDPLSMFAKVPARISKVEAAASRLIRSSLLWRNFCKEQYPVKKGGKGDCDPTSILSPSKGKRKLAATQFVPGSRTSYFPGPVVRESLFPFARGKG